MDFLRSIGFSNYQKQKMFVSKFLSVFDILNFNIRIGVVMYSNDVKVDIFFGFILIFLEFQKVVNNFLYYVRGINMGDVIYFVRKVGFVKGVVRLEVVYIMIVFIDGFLMDFEKICREFFLVYDVGIYVFVIGIGKGVDIVGFGVIVSNLDKNFFFYVENFDVLSFIRILLVIRICEVLLKDEVVLISGKNLKVNYIDVFYLIRMFNFCNNY